MSPVDADLLIAVALVFAAFAVTSLVQMSRAKRWCDRENARLRADYEAAREKAQRDGTRPPFPPNVWRCDL